LSVINDLRSHGLAAARTAKQARTELSLPTKATPRSGASSRPGDSATSFTCFTWAENMKIVFTRFLVRLII
jgi:hypothetical protein